MVNTIARAARRSVGHPVDVASGVQFTAWHDIAIPGMVPLVMRRFYSTELLDAPESAMGRGWVHFFDMSLFRDVHRYMLFGHDGEWVDFDDRDGNVDKGGSAFNFPHSMELRRESGNYAVYHWHDWQTEVRKLLFRVRDDHGMMLEAIETPAGHGIALTYGGGRLVEARQKVERRRLLFDYDSRGLISSVLVASPTSQPNLVARYEYDDRKRLVSVFDAMGAPLRYAYDERHRLIREISRGGAVYHINYDGRGRCIEAGGEGGYGLCKLQYDEPGKSTRVTDSLGNVTQYKLNDHGQVVSETLPNGTVLTTQFDDYGRVVSKSGYLGGMTSYVYNERGEVSEVSYPAGGSTKIEHNGQHQPTSVTEANGARWVFQYERGALVGVKNPLGAATRYIYNPDNILSEIQTPGGNRIAIRHSEAWDSTAYSDEYGLRASYGYDSRLNLTSIQDSRGMVRRFEYDARGYLVAVIEADMSKRRTVRGADGEVSEYIDENGFSAKFTYNSYSDLVRIVDPAGSAYEFELDNEGRVRKITNPKGETAAYSYDSLGRVTESKFFDGRIETFSYDDGARRIRHRKPDNTVLEYLLDYDEELIRVLGPSGEILRRIYDGGGLLVEALTKDAEVKLEYDLCGRPVVEIQNGKRLEYSYHQHGYLARQQFDGSKTGPLIFDHDKRGRLLAIRGQEKIYERFEYDNADLLVKREMGTTTELLDYDSRRRVRSKKVTRAGGGEIISRSFAYNSMDNLTKVVDSLRGETSYAYGPDEHLVATVDSRRGAISYVYDQCANLVTKGQNESLVYQAGNRLAQRGSTTYVRDANGNVATSQTGEKITRYRYDLLGQLIEVTHPDHKVTAYGYDGLGRRVFKVHDGKRTEFYWAGDDLLSEHSDGSVTDYAITHFNPLMIWEDGKVRHALTAVLGIPCELIDDRGSLVWQGTYDEWGVLLQEDARGASNRLRFPGQYRDAETGLHYNRSRYYDPFAGQYISPDPLGLVGGLNEFLYAPNPVNWADPLGLTCGKTGCDTYSVYVLKKKNKIVYVGITMQEEEERGSQHKAAGKDFDKMVIVAEDLPDRRSARDIEGSALYHIKKGSVSDGISPGGLQNEKRLDGGYYHSYSKDTPHTLKKAASVNKVLGEKVRSHPYKKL